MNDPTQMLQNMLQPGGLKTSLFPPSSRYCGLDTATLKTIHGKEIIYLCRRFCPPLESFVPVHEHCAVQGDRLDNIAAHYLGDPEQFWRLCDANGAMRPDELSETIGRRLRITLPEGIPGASNA